MISTLVTGLQKYERRKIDIRLFSIYAKFTPEMIILASYSESYGIIATKYTENSHWLN